MLDSFRNPLTRRRLAVVAASTPLAALEYALPICLEAVHAAVAAGWEVWTASAPGLNELLAAEAVECGGTVTIVLPNVAPVSHWTHVLRVVHGRAVRLITCATTPRDQWRGLACMHYHEILPVRLSLLAVAHVVVEGAAAAILLPSGSAPDHVSEHAAWLCHLLLTPVFDATTLGGLVALHEALPSTA